MGMKYSAQVNAVSVTAVQDIFELLAPSDAVIIVHEVIIGQYSDFGDSAAEILSVVLKYGDGYTSGSGGSSPTIVPLTNGQGAAGATLEANNTTQAVAGGGALDSFRAEAWNIQAPYQWLPTPEMRLEISPGDALVVSITAPADAISLNATIVWEELGG